MRCIRARHTTSWSWTAALCLTVHTHGLGGSCPDGHGCSATRSSQSRHQYHRRLPLYIAWGGYRSTVDRSSGEPQPRRAFAPPRPARFPQVGDSPSPGGSCVVCSWFLCCVGDMGPAGVTQPGQPQACTGDCAVPAYNTPTKPRLGVRSHTRPRRLTAVLCPALHLCVLSEVRETPDAPTSRWAAGAKRHHSSCRRAHPLAPQRRVIVPCINPAQWLHALSLQRDSILSSQASQRRRGQGRGFHQRRSAAASPRLPLDNA